MPSRSEWEAKLTSWVKPASQAEQDKRDRTEQAIGDALSAARLPSGIKTYAKGSYANNTNVRQDSDVDIAVEYTGLYYYDLIGDLKDKTAVDAGLSSGGASGPYSGTTGPKELKDDVEAAMVSAFGRAAVTRGNKAITVRETTRSLAADVVPCFTLKEFYAPGVFRQGTRIWPDTGLPIDNYPAQHLQNGRDKNSPERTHRRFKGMVRAVKHLENEMVDNGHPEVPSYLLECLVYNVEDGLFGHTTLYDDFRAVIATIWLGTKPGGDGGEWFEVNGIKYLFHVWQKWTREQAHEFAARAWAYVGFEG
jgi:hypothetical protein